MDNSALARGDDEDEYESDFDLSQTNFENAPKVDAAISVKVQSEEEVVQKVKSRKSTSRNRSKTQNSLRKTVQSRKRNSYLYPSFMRDTDQNRPP